MPERKIRFILELAEECELSYKTLNFSLKYTMTQEQIYTRKKKIARFCFVLLVLITSFGFWKAIYENPEIRTNSKQFFMADTENQASPVFFWIGRNSDK